MRASLRALQSYNLYFYSHKSIQLSSSLSISIVIQSSNQDPAAAFSPKVFYDGIRRPAHTNRARMSMEKQRNPALKPATKSKKNQVYAIVRPVMNSLVNS